MFLPHPRVKVSIVESLRDREVACSASDRQGFNFESCVWRTVSSQSSLHHQEVLLAQFSLYVHKGGLKPDSFHLHMFSRCSVWSSVWSFTCSTRVTGDWLTFCLSSAGVRGDGLKLYWYYSFLRKALLLVIISHQLLWPRGAFRAWLILSEKKQLTVYMK